MATVILVNYIHYDGIGDFQHLLDIAKAIHPFALEAGVEIVPLILCRSNLEETVRTRLNALNIKLKPFLFTLENPYPSLEALNQQFFEFVSGDVELQNNLNRALVIMQISTATTKYQKDMLLKYCYPNIPIVTIAEHSGLRTTASFHPFARDFDARDKFTKVRNINDRRMGLVASLEAGMPSYGVKLQSPLSISKEEALLTFTDSRYLRILLKKESTQPIEPQELTDFLHRTQIITAYLQEQTSIIKFILYCIEHEKHTPKDILFHLNKHPLFEPKLRYMFAVDELGPYVFSAMEHRRGQMVVPKFEAELIAGGFQKYDFDNVEINLEINVNGAIRTIRFGSSATVKKTVRILVGFYLEDEDYNKLYHLTDSVVAVSGDNTLEKALSHNKLPFLQSADKYTFELAMCALYEISLASLPSASVQLKQYFSNYFLNKNMRLDLACRREELLQADWQEMHAAWGAVGDYLRKNHNFYHHLKAIFYEALLHASAQQGDLKLLNIIYGNAPEINIGLPNKLGQTAFELATAGNHTAYLNAFLLLFQPSLTPVEIEQVKSKRLSGQHGLCFFKCPVDSQDILSENEQQSGMSMELDGAYANNMLLNLSDTF